MTTQTVTQHESQLADMMEEVLDIQPSFIMDYKDAIVKKISDTKYLYGYLADDGDSENPLVDWDGAGRHYSAHRDSDTHAEMQESLGLDGDWNENHELAQDFPDVLRRYWIKEAADDADFQEWCQEAGRPPLDEAKLAAYYARKAERFWRDTGGCAFAWSYDRKDIWDFEEATARASESAYEELKETGEIGDPDVVMLDCYQHSGIAWSVSGEGMQCNFDTASGAGVWVPDDSTREEIAIRGKKAYAFGQVIKTGGSTGNGRKPYFFKLDEQFGGSESMRAETWSEAFEALKQCIKSNKLRLPMKKAERETLIEKGKSRARSEIARSSIDLLNDYLNGNVFGIIIATFEVNGDGEPEHVEDDSVWGFYGDDDAYDSLKSEIEARDS